MTKLFWSQTLCPMNTPRITDGQRLPVVGRRGRVALEPSVEKYKIEKNMSTG